MPIQALKMHSLGTPVPFWTQCAMLSGVTSSSCLASHSPTEQGVHVLVVTQLSSRLSLVSGQMHNSKARTCALTLSCGPQCLCACLFCGRQCHPASDMGPRLTVFVPVGLVSCHSDGIQFSFSVLCPSRQHEDTALVPSLISLKKKTSHMS